MFISSDVIGPLASGIEISEDSTSSLLLERLQNVAAASNITISKGDILQSEAQRRLLCYTYRLQFKINCLQREVKTCEHAFSEIAHSMNRLFQD